MAYINMPSRPDEDTVDFELPDEMAECVYEAIELGRRMARSSENFSFAHCPFAAESDLYYAWQKGFLSMGRRSPQERALFRREEKVNWKRDGF